MPACASAVLGFEGANPSLQQCTAQQPGSAVKRLFVTVLLAIALGGLASEETISIARSPMIAALPSSTTKAISNSVPFHTILYYYAGGPRGQPISNCTGRGNFTFGGCAFAGIAVPEINDLKSWSGFSNFDFPPACCGWSNPSLPQVDFETRTVLVVSPGVGHLGEKFNLTEVIMSD